MNSGAINQLYTTGARGATVRWRCLEAAYNASKAMCMLLQRRVFVRRAAGPPRWGALWRRRRHSPAATSSSQLTASACGTPCLMHRSAWGGLALLCSARCHSIRNLAHAGGALARVLAEELPLVVLPQRVPLRVLDGHPACRGWVREGTQAAGRHGISRMGTHASARRRSSRRCCRALWLRVVRALPDGVFVLAHFLDVGVGAGSQHSRLGRVELLHAAVCSVGRAARVGRAGQMRASCCPSLYLLRPHARAGAGASEAASLPSLPLSTRCASGAGRAGTGRLARVRARARACAQRREPRTPHRHGRRQAAGVARRRPGERRRSAASAPQLRQNSTVYFGPLFPMVLVVTALLPRSQECRARATGTDTDSRS